MSIFTPVSFFLFKSYFSSISPSSFGGSCLAGCFTNSFTFFFAFSTGIFVPLRLHIPPDIPFLRSGIRSFFRLSPRSASSYNPQDLLHVQSLLPHPDSIHLHIFQLLMQHRLHTHIHVLHLLHCGRTTLLHIRKDRFLLHQTFPAILQMSLQNQHHFLQFFA